MNNTWNEPSLMVNDAHGVYMVELFVKEQEKTKSFLWSQLLKMFNSDELNILKDCNNINHLELCDDLTNSTFKTKTGQKYSIAYNDGGLWAIPNNFMRNEKKCSEFFCN